MFHSFDIDLAKAYGVNEAILLNNIAFWVMKNKANKQNYFEGKYWTFNSVKAYSDLFPYLSASTIKRALKHLKDEGVIMTGNFNNDQHNRTNFYTLTEKGIALVSSRTEALGQNDQMEQVKMTELIFNNNSDSTDINADINTPPILSPLEKRKLLFKQFWEAYPKCERKVNYEGCEKKFIQIENLETIFPDIMASLELWKRRWSKDNNKFVPTTHKWINQQYWTAQDERMEREQLVEDVTKKHINDFLL